MLLIDFWDDDFPKGQERMSDVFNGIGGSAQNKRGGTAGIWAPLTSPISYMASIPVDPFFTRIAGADTASSLISEDLVPPYCYMYADEDPAIPDLDYGLSFFAPNNQAALAVGVKHLRSGEYVIIGAGPDLERGAYNVATDGMGFPYESSNGLSSHGDIVVRSG